MSALGRAITELDKVAWGLMTTDDRAAIRDARRLLLDILDRNGYELPTMYSSRIRKINKSGAD